MIVTSGHPLLCDGCRIGQRNAYRLVIANHFQHGTAHEEVAGPMALPSFKPVFLSSVSGIYMIFDFSPGSLTVVWAIASLQCLLRKGDVDGEFFLLVPYAAALDHASWLRNGSEETRIYAVNAQDQVRQYPVVECHRVTHRLGTQTGVLLLASFKNIIKIQTS